MSYYLIENISRTGIMMAVCLKIKIMIETLISYFAEPKLKRKP